MARGYPGAFGRKVNAPYVWIPLMRRCSSLPFFDRAGRCRLLHLDLLVLLGFGVSHVFFNRGEIYTSVPLVYPVLLYLLVRMLMVGLRAAAAGRAARAAASRSAWLALALIFLVGFRVGAQPHRLERDRRRLLGRDRRRPDRARRAAVRRRFPADNALGDTYGPGQLLAYVPFELRFPWIGQLGRPAGRPRRGDRLRPATIGGAAPARPAAAAGPRGHALGLVLAYAWAAYPVHALRARTRMPTTRSSRCCVTLRVPRARSSVARAAASRSRSPRRRSSRRSRWRRCSLDDRAARATRSRSALAFAAVARARVAARSSRTAACASSGTARSASSSARESPFSIWGQDAPRPGCRTS